MPPFHGGSPHTAGATYKSFTDTWPSDAVMTTPPKLSPLSSTASEIVTQTNLHSR